MNKFTVAIENGSKNKWSFNNLESAKAFSNFIVDDIVKTGGEHIASRWSQASTLIITEEDSDGNFVQNWPGHVLLNIERENK